METEPNPWELYAKMFYCRLFEDAVEGLWQEGLISGEMHLGTGEEAIIAGVLAHLAEEDALALDHRGSAALLLKGVDPLALLRELLGRPDGLCAGMGGHMHLFSPEHLAATSGIVGAEGPAAAGFGLAAQMLRPGAVAVAFFGEGAMNQGMLMESMNLAAAWKLPVVFVCKDDRWSITTPSEEATGGSLKARARSMGIPVFEADGRDALSVWEAAGKAVATARSGKGPAYLHAGCVHLEGHFLGYQLIRMLRHPFREMPAMVGPMLGAILRRGAALREKLAGLKMVLAATNATLQDPRRNPGSDPLRRARLALQVNPERLNEVESRVRAEVQETFSAALQEVPA